MPTVNEEFADAVIRHQIGLRRLSNSTTQRIISLLNRTRPDIAKLLTDRLDDVGEGINVSARRLQRIDNELQQILRQAHAQIRSTIYEESEALAVHEIEWNQDTFEKLSPVAISYTAPTASQLEAIVYSQPFRGKLLRDWVEDIEPSDRSRIMQAIRIGAVEGETPTQVVRRVNGTRAARYSDGVREVTRRNLQSLVQTATSHINNRARQTWAESTGVVQKELYQATLDSRTCFVAGTMVRTPDGEKDISLIRAGEQVIGGSGEPRIVQATMRAKKSDLVRVTLSNGQSAICTSDHQWLTESGWQEAKDLKPGGKLRHKL